MSLSQHDMANEDTHLCQMQVSAGPPVKRTKYFGAANNVTSDGYRSLGIVKAGGQTADAAHMFSQAQPEQDMSFTDIFMAPPDQGMFDLYTSTSECNPHIQTTCQ